MSHRQQLVSEWRTRLEECQLDADGERSVVRIGGFHRPRTTWGWVRRIYGKVYRFLISRYASPEFAGDLKLPRLDEHRGGMRFVALVSTGPGKPPRSAETIRAVLEAIHAGNSPGVEGGRLMAGLSTESPIIAGVFLVRSMAEHFRQLLAEQGIEACVSRYGRRFRLEVPLSKYSGAKEFLLAEDAQRQDRLASLWPQPLMFLQIGAAAGGMLLAGAKSHNPPILEEFIVFFFVGAVVGGAAGATIDFMLRLLRSMR